MKVIAFNGSPKKEGVQIMKTLGKNMAWLMKLVENGKDKINTLSQFTYKTLLT